MFAKFHKSFGTMVDKSLQPVWISSAHVTDVRPSSKGAEINLTSGSTLYVIESPERVLDALLAHKPAVA